MPNLPMRVLVCEGKHLPGDAIVMMLQQLGYRDVLLVDSGDQAISLLNDIGAVDIVVIDLQMEGMDCLDFLQSVGRSRQVKSVIIGAGFSLELRQIVGEIIALLGLKLLGEVQRHTGLETLAVLLGAHLASPTLKPLPTIEIAGDQAIRHALADQQLRTWFQPKFELQTGNIFGVEALARWHHPAHGILLPGVFLPALERLGLMNNLLFIQLQHGLELRQRALLLGHQLNVALNIDAGQLECVRFSSRVKQILANFGAPGDCLTFELTEHTALDTSTGALNNLVRLRLMGCGLSLDDFGSGFSSLQRLCELPFTELKLDGRFAQGFLVDPYRRAAIVNTLALGEMLDIPVVIEGIETSAQREALSALSVRMGQGYLCAPALLDIELLALLERGNYFEEKCVDVLPRSLPAEGGLRNGHSG